MFSVNSEFAALKLVIIGIGAPYQPDKTLAGSNLAEYPFIPDTDRKAEVLALEYPTEALLLEEFKGFATILTNHGVEVLFADPGAAYSIDYTCPRDIGFVIGQQFFIANMAVASRADEYKTIEPIIQGLQTLPTVRPPPGALLEGGDVVLLDQKTVLVGHNQRSNLAGAEYLQHLLANDGITVVPVKHRQLHLDCCLNPLGRGHMLIHPESLDDIPDATWQLLQQYQWIEVDTIEREHLATNVLSINPQTLVARDHPACSRVNESIERLGYTVITTGFDGVPATGGSFRCATLPLQRV